MKQIIFILVAVYLTSACQKEESSLTDRSILVFNKKLLSIPVVSNDAYYFVSQHDDALHVSSITSDGLFSDLVDLGNILPAGFTADSLSTIYTVLTSKKSTCFALPYYRNNSLAYRIVTLDSLDNLSWTVSDSVMFSNNKSTSQTICETSTGDIAIITSSAANSTSQPGQVSGPQVSDINITETIYSISSGTRSSASISTITGKTIVSICAIPRGYLIFANSIQINTPVVSQAQQTQSSYIMRKNASGSFDEKSLNDILLGTVLSVAVNDDTFIVSCTNSSQHDSYVPTVIAVDFTRGLVWTHSPAGTETMYFTSVQVATDGYFLAGAKFSGESFSWNNTSTVSNSRLFYTKIDGSGNSLWEKDLVVDPSIGVGVIEHKDGSLTWLASKLQFNTLSNILMVKTDNEGNIK